MKVLLFSRDPGSANTIIPLVSRLKEKGHEIKLFGKDAALNRYKLFGLKGKDITKSIKEINIKNLNKFLRDEKVDCIVTGCIGNDFTERFLWKASEQLGIPSFAILDQWMNYQERFSKYVPSGPRAYNRKIKLDYLPSKIFLMDKYSKMEAVKEGFDKSRLVITGQPYFELIEKQKNQKGPNRNLFLKKLGAKPNHYIITFASDAISETFEKRASDFFGYDEKEILNELITALKSLLVNYPCLKITLIIRPHPRDNHRNYKEIINKNKNIGINLLIDKNSNGWDLIRSSDLICGMSSMFLIESILLGKPIMSIQIGLKSKNPFILSRRKIVKTILDRKTLLKELESTLVKGESRLYNFEVIKNPVKNIITYLEKNMFKLAIKGGKKVRIKKFPAYRPIGREEVNAAKRVIQSGILSRFLGVWHEDFYGGPEVQAFEKEWARYFKVKHAIAVNSATSGLYAAVGAIGTNPGDEIIVSPYSMSASAVAPLIYGAIPVFADIEEDYFCLSPDSVESKITKRTKAIIVVDILGLPYNCEKINKIAKKHKLIVIEDSAQAPGATYKKKYTGTLGDIGVYSLNYHKNIHSGEGGVVVTNNDELAEKVRLIRNHAEQVVEAKGHKDLTNMVGFNFRMTEIEAAIGREQLKKLSGLQKKRVSNINYLDSKLSQIPCLEPAKTRPGCTHAYYVHPIKYVESATGIHRDRFVEAVKAELTPITLRETEGVKVGAGYAKPIYLLPIFQRKIAFGDKGYPWKNSLYKSKTSYKKGSCPIVEKMYYDTLITHDMFHPFLTKKDLDDVITAFQKVWENIKELK